MASFADKIKITIDVIGDKASSSLGKFRTDLDNAEGATGKFKVAAGGAFDYVKQNAAQFAVAGGAALVAFGAKAVSAFADLGIEAGKLSDALGMPVEDASRLMEVAGDLGIETKTLESTIGRMNRTAADTPGAFDDIGAAIVRNADGTVNVNETFLSTVDALNKIPDATERASAAQKIFGRSWMDIAELVGQGADDVRASLDSVSDAKVIDESEVQKAREFRAAMDRFKDSIEDITIAVGEGLIPIVSSGTEGIAAMVEVADKLKLIDLAGWFSSMTNPISQFNRVLATARGEADLFGRSVTDVNDEQMSFVQAAKDAGVAGSEVKAALDAGVTSWAGYQAWVETAGEATTETAAASIDLSAELAIERARLDELTKSTITATAGLYGMESGALALAEATANLERKEAETAAVIQSSTATDAEKSAALIDLRQEQIAVAEQSMALAEKYATERGAAEGSTEAARLQVEKLRELQAQYPENAAALDPYINNLLSIPGVVDTTVSIDTAAANAALDGLLAKLGQAGIQVSQQAAVAAARFNTGQSSTGAPTYVTNNYPAGVRPVDVAQASRTYGRTQGPT